LDEYYSRRVACPTTGTCSDLQKQKRKCTRHWFTSLVSSLKAYSNKHAYAGPLNSFTHLRALLVLHDRRILGINLTVTYLILEAGGVEVPLR